MHEYIASQIAHDAIEDRIRAADARRAARAVRAAARESRYVEQVAGTPVPTRTWAWRLFHARTSAA